MKRWHRLGFKQQIVLGYVAASVLTVVLIGVVLYYSIGAVVLRENISSVEMAVEKSGVAVENYLDQAKDMATLLLLNPDTLAYFGSDPMDSEQSSRVKDRLEDFLSNMLLVEENMESIIMVGKDGRIISNEAGLTMAMSEDMMKENWYVDALNSDAMPTLTSARMQKFNMDKDHWVISLSQEMVDGEGNHLGVLVCDFKYSAIEVALQGFDMGSGGYIYILNAEDQVVYHKDTSYFLDGALKDELIAMSHMTLGYDQATNKVIHSQSIGGTDWTLYGVATLDNLTIIYRQLIETLISVGIIGLLIMSVAGIYIGNRMTRPIEKLSDAMSAIEDGLTDQDIDLNGALEITSLAEHYNAMMARIRQLIEDLSLKEQAIRAYELGVLQSQINPHFLYNTLDTIVWMAEFDDSEKVIQVTKALAKFFRLSLNGGEEMTTIDKELDHVRQYLIIQKERYGDQLKFTLDARDDLLETSVPKIILQPLVENAIYHGIRPKGDTGLIKVKCQEDQDVLILSVEDDGVGFDPSKDQRDRDKVRLGGVGIKNVHDRIRLKYGPEYGLSVQSEVGVGTRVEIKMPLLGTEEKNS